MLVTFIVLEFLNSTRGIFIWQRGDARLNYRMPVRQLREAASHNSDILDTSNSFPVG